MHDVYVAVLLISLLFIFHICVLFAYSQEVVTIILSLEYLIYCNYIIYNVITFTDRIIHIHNHNHSLA